MTSQPTDLETVFRANHDFVWGVARGLGASPDQADDAVQDVFLVVRRKAEDFDTTLSIRPWLAGITRRVLADHRKKQRRAKAREARADAPSLASNPEPKVIAEQRARAVETFLETLPEEQREVFVLIQVEGLTLKEAAETTGSNSNTVSSRLRLARKRFSAFAAEWRQREEEAR